MDPADDLTLLQAALAVRRNAYVPYSNFPVGAAIRSTSGRVYVGTNVDNASFPMTSCAEANAIGSMVAAGETAIAAILVIGGPGEVTRACPPCGGCRQRILEFSTDGTVVLMATAKAIVERFTIGDLLPSSFSSHQLRGDGDT